MKGYKAFNKDLTCRNGYEFEIGKEYKHEGEIKPCESGFHFCKKLEDCYMFYAQNSDTRICRVEALGEVKTDDGIKYVTDRIKIVSEVKNPHERSNLGNGNTGYANWGNGNTGSNNCGDENTGYWNVGDENVGNGNYGDHNVGDWNFGNNNVGRNNLGTSNTGNSNTGYRNTGDRNSGRYNSGDNNSGDWNTGDWNCGDRNTGVFNTETSKINMFDKPSRWTMTDWLRSEAWYVLDDMPHTTTIFIRACEMSDKEKAEHPEYSKLNGYTKMKLITTEDRQKWWDNLNVDKDKIFRTLPNFDEQKFCRCIGIEHW